MAKYRKKPVEVEASQWFKNGDHPADYVSAIEAANGGLVESEGKVVRYYRHPSMNGKNLCATCWRTMHEHGWIDTIQGGHIVHPGDWIITDERVIGESEHGHYYPCKPDIFEATYEAVSE